MRSLNYHHLHYFWAVAKEGNLTRAASLLYVSQSALSTQIKLLEEQLGYELFAREGRRLTLTEAGRLALASAETIFTAGNDLVALLREGGHRGRQQLRLGSVSTLSRNFQENFIRPLFARSDIELMLQSAGLDELLARLGRHELDVVLSNRRVHPDADHPWRCRRVARQAVSLVGKPRRPARAFRFPEELAEVPLLLPATGSDVRSAFDLLCEQREIRYHALAEVDDMAMLRLLARDTGAVALLPAVVVRDELRSRRLVAFCTVPGVYENFYAVTVKRSFEPQLLKVLLRRPGEEVLATEAAGRHGSKG